MIHISCYARDVTPIDSVQTPVTGVKNGVKQSKPKIWKVKQSKEHCKLGSSTVKGQPDIKSHQSTIQHLVEQVQSRVKGLFEWRSSDQGPKFKVKNLTPVVGVRTSPLE